MHHVKMAENPNDLGDLTPDEIEARKVLAQNLQRLMNSNPKLDSNPKLSKRAGVGVATLSRIMSMKTGANLDTITRLAGVFGMAPWQMLVPNLSPKNPQILRSSGAMEDALYEKIRKVVDEEVRGRGSDSGFGELK